MLYISVDVNIPSTMHQEEKNEQKNSEVLNCGSLFVVHFGDGERDCEHAQSDGACGEHVERSNV